MTGPARPVCLSATSAPMPLLAPLATQLVIEPSLLHIDALVSPFTSISPAPAPAVSISALLAPHPRPVPPATALLCASSVRAVYASAPTTTTTTAATSSASRAHMAA